MKRSSGMITTLVSGLGAIALLQGAALAFEGAGAASRPTYSVEFDRCMDKAQANDFMVTDCIRAEWKQWDAKLNANYKRALARLDRPKQLKLRSEQRLWLQQQKRTCDNISTNKGGTAEPAEIADCYLEWTAKRADLLAHYPSGVH